MMFTPSFRIEGNAGNFHQKQTTSYWQTRPRCPLAMLTKHSSHSRLSTGNQVGRKATPVGTGDSCPSARTQFDKIVVALDKGNHAQKRDLLSPLVKLGRLEANGTQ